MSKLSERLKKAHKKVKPRTPLWLGPSGEGWNGGVTQSMLGSYLVCKERFRIAYVDGLQPISTFRHAIEYGQMWHHCEEQLARGDDWQRGLKAHCTKLVKKYPTQGPEVNKWYNVCLIQFPLYIDHWKHQPDVKNREPLMQEVAFDVPYQLPSGRVVRLRGKWDSVDTIGKGKNAGIWLQENKTKGQVDEREIKTQLLFDLQTMTYLTALIVQQEDRPSKIKGIRYNVIRRPLSGGKGSIKQKKGSKNIPPETLDEYYNRLRAVIQEDLDQGEANTYFHRWKATVLPEDVERFRRECLDPMLENLCDDYEWWECCLRTGLNPFDGLARCANTNNQLSRHFRFPYGVWNPLTDGRGSDLDEYLATGGTVGLTKDVELFEELQDA